MRTPPALGVHDEGVRIEPIPRGPVSASDTDAVALRNPPIKLHMRERVPDATGLIDTADLGGQLSELEASGLVGHLNVERLASGRTVVSTHAGTQAERNAWLMGLSHAT